MTGLSLLTFLRLVVERTSGRTSPTLIVWPSLPAARATSGEATAEAADAATAPAAAASTARRDRTASDVIPSSSRTIPRSGSPRPDGPEAGQRHPFCRGRPSRDETGRTW